MAAARRVLLVNLGSPKSPEVADVRAYLKEFLSDPLVIDAPALIRWFVLRCFILPKRPHASAAAYRLIWTDLGSPLVVTSKRVAERLGEKIGEPVALAMRYGEPSIRETLTALRDEGVAELRVIPLYPHYAKSSYETVEKKIRREAARLGSPFRLSFQEPFHSEAKYIEALRQVSEPYVSGSKRAPPYDHLLFSFHGIPVRHVEKRDPTGKHCLRTADCCLSGHPATERCYRSHCLRTAEALAAALDLPREKWSLSFQSRLGRDPWLPPSTEETLVELAHRGTERLLVICPSFVSDCLETLEEIAIRGRESFLAAGGKSFAMIPCMNEHPAWIDALAGYAR